MQASTPALPVCASENREGTLVAAIEHASHLLPTQGPIRVFVHHNTLHAFEHYKFWEGVASWLENSLPTLLFRGTLS